MSNSFRSRARSIAALGVAGALVVGGVALAQGGSGGKFHHGRPPAGKRMPPPPAGPLTRNLTYAQFHVQRKGQAEVLRLDRGKVVSVSESSITVAENDGGEVTISVDGSTKVLAGPGREIAVTDLKTGREVLVCGPEGGTAKTIIVPPKRGRHGLRGHRRHGHRPPPGAFGGPQGGPPGEGS